MKKMLLALLCACLLFPDCVNKEKDDMTEAEIMALPEIEKSRSLPFVKPIELKKAIAAVDAYRKHGALVIEALNKKEYGIAHDPAELEKYMTGHFRDFVATHKKAEVAGYTWQVGFGYGIARKDGVRRLNIYIFPVLTKTDPASKKIAIQDYFKLRKDNSKDTAYYVPDAVPGSPAPTRVDEPSFVFDEGALWP